MSTIDPSLLDPTDKPPDGSGDPDNPVNYLSATERGWKGEAQTQFSNAKTDIEGLETGKEDAGTAAAAVAAHDASAAAHGGVEAAYVAHAAAGNPHTDSASLTDLSNHKSGGTGEHPVFTDSQDGFAPASGGGTINFLRADGSWAAPPGGGGGGVSPSSPYTSGNLLVADNAGAGSESANTPVTVPDGGLITSTAGTLTPVAQGLANRPLVSNGAGTPSYTLLLGAGIAADTVANNNLTETGAGTIKGNPSGSTANPQDFAINSLAENSTASGFALGTDQFGTGLARVPLSSLGGSSGTVQDIAKDGSVVVSDATQIDFRDTGDATVTVFDAGSGVARVTVDATAGGGGGGVGAGTPFTVGQLTEISSAAGDGEIVSSGLTAATINGHIGDVDIHADHSAISVIAGAGLTGGGTIAANRTLDVGAGTGISVAADAISVDEAAITHNNLGGLTTGNPHTQYALLAGATFSGSVDTSGSATVSEQGVNILQPVEIVDGSATITPDLSAGNSPWIVATTTGAFTLNPPTSGFGSGIVQVEGASSITAGAFTRKTNDPPGSPGPAFGFFTRRANGETMISWTNGV